MIGRIPILDVSPTITVDTASGPVPRPAKAVTGEPFEVSATVFREGHDPIGANAVLRDPSGRRAPFTRMRELAPGTDRWGATVLATAEGDWTFAVEAWSDPVAGWRHAAEIKIPAALSGGPGGDVADAELTLEEGAQLLERAAHGVPKEDGRPQLLAAAAKLRDRRTDLGTRLAAGTDPVVSGVLARHPLRDLVTSTDRKPLRVDRPRALFGSWYELFPRSEGATANPPRSGTLRSAAERLPAVAAMGFDVVYLPPVHPIGQAYRKGPNNSLRPGPEDVGSPWAIGSPEGGHDAVHPDLGTMEDFDAFVVRARELRLEVALDFALQCSPDHPWVQKHPDWFRHRADGSIAYAENPPKKYQDIYPLEFDGSADGMDGLVEETLRLLRHWMAHGVRIFRVDNPHTKPVVFWERVLGEIARTDPDVVFLAEAFTRPALMRTLAKIGFHQSYTYFTWRNNAEELTGHLSELAYETAAYMRPNLFVNTPDILHAYLQHGGRPAFAVRAVLAATMAPSWGVYAGFELFENTPVRPGSEEYLDSEKYQLRPRDWAAAEAENRTLSPLLATLNRLRRTHPALQELRNIRFHHPDNDQIIAYSKRSERGTFLESPVDPAAVEAAADGTAGTAGDTVIVVVNLDPRHAQETTLTLDMPALGLTEEDRLTVRDELTGAVYDWGRQNYVRLDPSRQSAHIFNVTASRFGGPQ